MEKSFNYGFKHRKERIMRNKFSKFLIYLLVVSAVIGSSIPSFAAKSPYVLHDTVESQYLGSGIVHENIRRFTSQGWHNINVLRVDLNDEYAEVKGLVSGKGVSDRQAVSKLVQENNAVAGVNGDFFNYTPISHPAGFFVDNNEVLSIPDRAKPTFYLDNNKNPDIAFIDRTMRLNSIDSGKSITIYYINKLSSKYQVATILNRHWGEKSPGNRFNKDSVEMVVSNNLVKEIRIGQGPVNIPKDGFVVTTFGAGKKNIVDNFKVGDKVRLDVTTGPNIDNIQFAISGGSVLLKNGNIVSTKGAAGNPNGSAARTGLGINQAGDQLIIATVDSSGPYRGVSQQDFASILKELGAYNALNLDGGASTTMAIKPIEKQAVEVANKPSDGSQRKVSNGVGVYSNAPRGELSYIKVQADDSKMFVNTSRKFSIKAYDQYHHPLEVNQKDVVYTVKGIDGEITGNTLKANSSGKALVTADYNGVVASTEVRVLGPAKALVIPMDKFNLNPNGKKNLGAFGPYYGIDGNGLKAKIYPEDIEFTVTNELGHVENNVFYSNGKTGAGAISLSVGDAINNILVAIGGEEKLIEDFENLNNLKFSSYPNYVEGSVGLSPDAKTGNTSGKIVYDFSKGDVTRAAYMELRPNGQKGIKFDYNPTRLGLWVKGDGQGSWLRGHIVDNNGKAHSIDFSKSLNFTDWQYVEATIPNIANPITLDRIYVVETNPEKKHSGEILIDGLTAVYPAKYDSTGLPKPTSFTDEKNIKSEKTQEGFSFIVTKAQPDIDKIAEFNASGQIQNKANAHDVSIFMGGSNTEFIKSIQSKLVLNTGINYMKREYQNVLFIDANSSKGGIRPTNPEQWKWLKSDLANSTKDHIVLILNTPIFGNGGFTDKLEADLLHDVLVETGETGKTIWVIHGGNSATTQVKDGIRYIQYDNRAVKDTNQIKSIKAIEFIVNGKDITYQINPMFGN